MREEEPRPEEACRDVVGRGSSDDPLVACGLTKPLQVIQRIQRTAAIEVYPEI